MSNYLTRVLTALTATVVIGTAACGGGGSDNPFIGTVLLAGQAFLPPGVGGSSADRLVVAANAPVSVIDLSRPQATQVVATGTTDQEGRYSATVQSTSSAAVIVNSTVRVSGLLNPDEELVEKDFNGITDIACEAGVTAVRSGAITADQLDEDRISNLERAAEIYVENNPIDYSDRAAVSAAAVAVREATADGAVAPS
jgi:hypothetical protein